MARLPRHLILSDINHIIIRGIGHMDLFFNDEDFTHFLKILKRFKTVDEIEIHAYCLMNNHVHMLVKGSPERIPVFIKRLGVSYAFYFNNTKQHTGHIFQNRYRSEPVSDSFYYLNVIRYILRNPETAGISEWDQYRYSSAGYFLTGKSDGLTNPSEALAMIGGRKNFYDFMNRDDGSADDKFYERDNMNQKRSLTDLKASGLINSICSIESPTDLQMLKKAERDSYLGRIKKTGMSLRQIERLTGISKSVIQRA